MQTSDCHKYVTDLIINFIYYVRKVEVVSVSVCDKKKKRVNKFK